MQIQVRINEEGALRNQRYAFTDRFALVTELLQNARRAGATRIDITHDAAAKRLCVRDDGHGIGDIQKLLTFNESASRPTRHWPRRATFALSHSRRLAGGCRLECEVLSRRHFGSAINVLADSLHVEPMAPVKV